MHNKVGRNDPCPCGSGQKYKKCHGKAEPQRNESFPVTQMQFDQGIIIKDYTGDKEETISLGSAGVLLDNVIFTAGTTENFNKDPGKFIFVLNVDIPALLPLNDGEEYTIKFEGDQYVFFHHTKKRGEEFYSTLDSTRLPFFSTLKIQGRSFDDRTKELE